VNSAIRKSQKQIYDKFHILSRLQFFGSGDCPVGQALAQPKDPNAAIGTQWPESAVALVSFGGRLRSGIMGNSGD
jgi:hypothetical protein